VKLGKAISKLRSQNGFSQEKLAELAGISTRYLQELEAGNYCPTVFIAERLRVALRTTWEEFLPPSTR
jgi:transcriptional regulator with XRE-family HTH domain